MSRAAKAFLIVASVISAAAGLTGYGLVMVATRGDDILTGFLTMLLGLGVFIICMHAWTDLR